MAQPSKPDVVVEIGKGTPRYASFTDDGTFSLSDTGKTAFFIEDNEQAAAALVVSDDTGGDDAARVFNADNGALVTMFFRKTADFPYLMRISYDGGAIDGYFSPYNEAFQTYNLTLDDGRRQATKVAMRLNPGIFSLYQDDPALGERRNRGLGIIIVTLGLWGSLAAQLQERADTNLVFRGFWDDLFKAAAVVFTSVGVVAMVAAVVPVFPAIASADPAISPAPITDGAFPGVPVSLGALLIDNLVTHNGHNPWPAPMFITPEPEPQKPAPPKPTVTARDRAGNLIGHHQTFHIAAPVGSELVFDLLLSHFPDGTIDAATFWYEPAAVDANVYVYRNLVQNGAGNQANQFKITRISSMATLPYTGEEGFGQLYFGIRFIKRDGNRVVDNLVINDNESGYMFRGPTESVESLHKDMVVMHICLATNSHSHPNGAVYTASLPPRPSLRPPCMFSTPILN